MVTTPEARRILAAAVHECCAPAGLLGFALADNHLHLELTCDRAMAGRVARRLALMLGWRLKILEGVEMRFIKPILDGAHLANTFRYLARQAERHGIDPSFDPWCETTSVPDLLGLRPAGRHVIEQVRTWLPRTTQDDVMRLIGLPGLREVPRANEPLDEVVDAALAAMMLPSLAGAGREVCRARRAIVAVVGARMSTAELAQLVGLSPCSLRRVRRQAADPALVRAIELQLGLRQLRRQRGVGLRDVSCCSS